MIEYIRLKSFKRFTEQEFHFPALTILTGINGAGKTSLIQALLLTKQAYTQTEPIVQLNGPFDLELGTFGDIVNHSADERKILLTIGLIDHETCTWSLTGDDLDLYAHAERQGGLREVSPFDAPRTFQYLSAERLGPRVYSKAETLPPVSIGVGSKGQFSAQVFETLGSMSIEERRASHPSDGSARLVKVQCERWLSRLTRPLQIDSQALKGTGLFTLRFRAETDWVKPTNMGFGVSYALPVILAGLTAAPNGVLIVENPEAHLHPAAQSQMGIFLASMAAAGVQVIAETHSDHLLNGIRRAIGELQALGADQAAVYHFDSGPDIAPARLSFTERGGVSSWPKSFFDQFQIDVQALTRISRRRQ